MKRWSLGSTELKRSRPTVVSKICPPNCWYFGVSVDSTFTMARKSMTPWSWALIASFGEEKNLPSPKAPGATFVIQYAPRAISSSFSDTTGSPEPGLRILLLAEIISLASICASSDSGTWTAIWSPSKSALNARQTSGWTWIALPSISTGRKAWIPWRWRVGARFKSTCLCLITFSRIAHTSGTPSSIRRPAPRMLYASSCLRSSATTKGRKSSRAMCFGRPHWSSRSSGPMTITERPE